MIHPKEMFIRSLTIKIKIIFPVLFLFATLSLGAQTYITHVTIADVENLKWIPDQTVVITNDLISDIGPVSELKIPHGGSLIDGTGKYLLPGLTDAHIHFFQNGGLYTRPDAIDLRSVVPYEDEIALAHENMEEVLRRYLRCGITNVIDVGSTYHFLKHRKEFENADYAPSIYMTGPLATTYEPREFENLEEDEPFHLVRTIEDGKKMVQQQLPHHPDFIKIWYIVGMDTSDLEVSARNYLPIVKAVIDEAHKNNLKVAVHATERITAQLAVESGCDFLVHSVEDEIISREFVDLLKQNKTVICPTLIVHGNYVRTFGQRHNFSNYELYHADPRQLGTLVDLKHLPDTAFVARVKTQANSQQVNNWLSDADSIRKVNLKILSDAGVAIATGTDAGNIGTLHASSYLSELKAMQDCGMSNWEIIRASTINGARVLDKDSEFGSIVEGKKANLILLEADPVENIENITKIFRVINRGIVINPDTLIKETPVALAQRQLNAYNFRNIDAFLEPYDEEVELYDFPGELMYTGKAKMRELYSDWFADTPDLHCELLGRIVQGNRVIDKERVQADNKVIEAVVIYQIENDKIKKVYFVR